MLKFENFKINQISDYNTLNFNQISDGKVSKCYQANDVIKKIYKMENNRMDYEVYALQKLRAYRHFPYIYKVEKEKKTIFMSYVGKSFKDIKKEEIPNNLQDQIDLIISILKMHDIFHRDLSISHFRISNNIVSLIDFGKCWYTKEQFDSNKLNKTACWNKLKYFNMDYIKTVINNFLKLKFKEFIID